VSRDRLVRMDISTSWAYDRRTRQLQRRYPEDWPVYWCAYMALLAEAWSSQRGDVTLEDAWVPALPCEYDAARAALESVGLIDADGRVPAEAWEEWYGPARARMQARSEMAKHAADRRWEQARMRSASGPHADRMLHTSHTSQPASGRRRGSIDPRSNGLAVTPTEGPCRICGHPVSAGSYTKVGPGFIEHDPCPQAAPPS